MNRFGEGRLCYVGAVIRVVSYFNRFISENTLFVHDLFIKQIINVPSKYDLSKHISDLSKL